MLDNLKTLVALNKYSTMSETATALGITQSAVSKRISTLERDLQQELIEHIGRKVKLTGNGERLVKRTGSLILELQKELYEEPTIGKGRIVLGVSEGILASWGAQVLKSIDEQIPELTLELHAYRNPVVIDRIKAGDYMLGICPGLYGDEQNLYIEHLIDEPFVIIPSGLKKRRNINIEAMDIITIDKFSTTWKSIEGQLKKFNIVPTKTVETFFSVAQLAINGFGNGLVPLGVARTLGIPPKQLVKIDKGEIVRPVSLVARKSIFTRALVNQFREELLIQIKKIY